MRVFQTKINKSYPRKAYEVEPLKSEIKESTSLPFVLSVMAILISLSSIYLQFFYEKFELNVSLIDTKVKSDSLQLALIYNNKGNQDATIISSEIFFYSGNNMDEKEKRLYFIQKQNSPEILAPNKQLYKSQAVQTFFKDIKLNEYDIDPKDTIKIGLDVQFLNENMLQAES